MPNNIEDVEQQAARVGLPFTPEDYAEAQAVMETRRKQLEQAAAQRATWVDRFNRWYPRFLRTLHGIGDTSITLVQTVLVGPGVLLVLSMLLIVEQQRVFHGVALFEVHEALATFSAWSLVILNLSLELLISYVENRARWVEPPRHEFSLRLFVRRVAYIIGRDVTWEPRPKSPAMRFRNVRRIVTFSILALALSGSMRVVIERTIGNWTEALTTILTRSSLLEMATWIGGLLFALAAVLSAQALSQYAARKAIEIAAVLSSGGETSAALEAAGMTGAAFLMARLKDKQRHRRAMASAAFVSHEGVFPVVSERSETTAGTHETPEMNITESVLQLVQWIKEHPESAFLSVRNAAKEAGVSATQMQRARDYLKRT